MSSKGGRKTEAGTQDKSARKLVATRAGDDDDDGNGDPDEPVVSSRKKRAEPQAKKDGPENSSRNVAVPVEDDDADDAGDDGDDVDDDGAGDAGESAGAGSKKRSRPDEIDNDDDDNDSARKEAAWRDFGDVNDNGPVEGGEAAEGLFNVKPFFADGAPHLTPKPSKKSAYHLCVAHALMHAR